MKQPMLADEVSNLRGETSLGSTLLMAIIAINDKQNRSWLKNFHLNQSQHTKNEVLVGKMEDSLDTNHYEASLTISTSESSNKLFNFSPSFPFSFSLPPNPTKMSKRLSLSSVNPRSLGSKDIQSKRYCTFSSPSTLMMMFWPEGTRILKLNPLLYCFSLLNFSQRIFRSAQGEMTYFFGSGLDVFSSVLMDYFFSTCLGKEPLFQIFCSCLGRQALQNSSSCCFLILRSSFNLRFSLMVFGLLYEKLPFLSSQYWFITPFSSISSCMHSLFANFNFLLISSRDSLISILCIICTSSMQFTLHTIILLRSLSRLKNTFNQSYITYSKAFNPNNLNCWFKVCSTKLSSENMRRKYGVSS